MPKTEIDPLLAAAVLFATASPLPHCGRRGRALYAQS